MLLYPTIINTIGMSVWIWTEPHSMRLKIKITIQKEVMNGAILQQVNGLNKI